MRLPTDGNAGANELGARHPFTTANRRMPVRPRRMQRRNGSHRAGRKRRGPRRTRQPNAACEPYRKSERSKRTGRVGNRHRRGRAETADRMSIPLETFCITTIHTDPSAARGTHLHSRRQRARIRDPAITPRPSSTPAAKVGLRVAWP